MTMADGGRSVAQRSAKQQQDVEIIYKSQKRRPEQEEWLPHVTAHVHTACVSDLSVSQSNCGQATGYRQSALRAAGP
jgi:hypothetical protein